MSRRSDPAPVRRALERSLPPVARSDLKRTAVPASPVPPAARWTKARVPFAPTVDGDSLTTVHHLRWLARQSQPAITDATLSRATTKSPRSLVVLQPLPPTTGQRKHLEHSNQREYEDASMKELWAVATAAAKQRLHKPTRVETLPPDPVRFQSNQTLEFQSEDPELSSGPTLARYRRLVGMHARSTLMRILREASARVARHRLHDASSRPIQRLVRRFLGRRRRDRLWYDLVEASVKIQGVWRKRMARLELALLRHHHQRREAAKLGAAIAIQQFYRGKVSRRLQRLCERRTTEYHAAQLLSRTLRRWRLTQSTRGKTGVESAVDCTLSPRVRMQQLRQLDGVHREPDLMVPDCVVPLVCTTLNEDSIGAINDSLCKVAWTNLSQCSNHEVGAARVEADPPRQSGSGRDVIVDQDEWKEPPCQDINVASSLIQCEVASLRKVDGFDHADPGHHASLAEQRYRPIIATEPDMIAQSEATLTLPAIALPQDNAPSHSYPPCSPTVPESDFEMNSSQPNGGEVEMEPLSEPPITLDPEIPTEDQESNRHARAVLANFLDIFVVPVLRNRLRRKHHAALRIQRLTRLWISQRHVQFRRQLHVLSLKSELQAHWQQQDSLILSSVLESNDASPGNGTCNSGSSVDDDNEDEELQDLLDGVDDTRDCGLSWIEILPTRNGVIPANLLLKMGSCHGPASASAPSWGLWRWSWATERWEPNRDLFGKAAAPPQPPLT